MESNLKNLFKTVFICLFISVISLITYDRFYATKIVALDTTTYLKEVQAEYIKGKMSDQDLENKLAKIKDALNAQPKNSVVLNAEVVMKNAKRIDP